MLFNQDSFKAYESQVLDTIDFDQFKPGTFGLNLNHLKAIDGLGAKTLVKLAECLQVPEDVSLLKYGINADFQTTFCMYPSWRVIEENETQTKDLYFVMGDFKAPLQSVFEAVSEKFAFAPEILTVGNENDRYEIAVFTFTQQAAIVRDSDKFSFIVKPSRDVEKAGQQLVDLFANSKGMQDLYQSLLDCGLVAGLSEGGLTFCHLKELPFGGYEVSNIVWEDKTVVAKQGKNAGNEVRIANWKFTAKSMLDGTMYGVDASKSSFFGKAISANNSYLKTASKEAGGKIYMMIDGHRELTQGISVEGRLLTNETVVTRMVQQIQAKAIAAATQQTVLPPSESPAPAMRSAAPVTANVGEQDSDDIPF